MAMRRRVQGAAAASSGAESDDAKRDRRSRSCGSALLKALLVTLFVIGAVVVTLAFRKGWFNATSTSAFAPNRVFTKSELAQYDGSDTSKPILLSVLGKVYDVSAEPSFYGKGSGYNFFAGRDASRSFIDGCFNVKCFDEEKGLEGLDKSQVDSIKEWAEFYEKEDKYVFVGTLEDFFVPDGVDQDQKEDKDKDSERDRQTTTI